MHRQKISFIKNKMREFQISSDEMPRHIGFEVEKVVMRYKIREGRVF